MSNVPPPPPQQGPGDDRPPMQLPVPQPGWIPGSDLPSAGQQPPYVAPPYVAPPYGPQPYGQPPYGQPPYGQPPYGGQPAGAPAPRAARPAWTKPAAIVAALVLVGGAAWFFTKGDDSSSGGLSTSAAAATLTEVLADVDVGETGVVTLSDCAGIDLDAIATVAPTGFPADTVAEGTTSADVARLGDRSRDPLILECGVVDQAVGAFAAFVGLAPSGDFETFLDRVTVNVTREDPLAFDGGTIHSFSFTDASGNAHGQAVWANDEIIASLDTIGPAADTDVAVEWLQAALPGMLTEAADLRASDVSE